MSTSQFVKRNELPNISKFVKNDKASQGVLSPFSITGANPTLSLIDTNGDDYEVKADANLLTLTNLTTALGISLKSNGQVVGIPKNIHVNTSAVGNVGTGLDSLHSFSLPAGSLANNGDYLRVSYSGKFASNDDDKRVVISFGGVTVADTSLADFDLGDWTLDILYIRLSSTSVRMAMLNTLGFINFLNGAAGGTGVAAATNVDATGLSNLNSNAQTMLVQGESATATNNNVVQNLSVIELTQVT
jgi:hypothetical protein